MGVGEGYWVRGRPYLKHLVNPAYPAASHVRGAYCPLSSLFKNLKCPVHTSVVQGDHIWKGGWTLGTIVLNSWGPLRALLPSRRGMPGTTGLVSRGQGGPCPRISAARASPARFELRGSEDQRCETCGAGEGLPRRD